MYQRLADIDQGYRLIGENLLNPRDWFVPLFLLRTHSSYLGGGHLALAGQVPESYMLIRGCLENAAYAFYFHRNPDSHQRWLRRHDSPKTKRAVEEEFRIRALLRVLRGRDQKLGEAATLLYERTIDFGAHPNERAVTQMLRLTETEAQRRFDMRYLIGHGEAMQLCLKTAAQAGICGLKVFEYVFPERYALLGLSDRLRTLQEGL